MPYYAVRVGRNPGIYGSWDECQAEVGGFPRAVFHKFPTLDQAKAYMGLTVDHVENCPLKIPDAEELMRPEEGEIIAWVDGSFHPVTHQIGYAMQCIHHDQHFYRVTGSSIPDESLRKMRNVTGELLAAQEALLYAQSLQGIHHLKIVYDYAGLEEWAMGRWKTTVPWIQQWVDLFRQAEGKGLQVTWVKVKSHSNDVMNDTVDQLAKEAAGFFKQNKQ